MAVPRRSFPWGSSAGWRLRDRRVSLSERSGRTFEGREQATEGDMAHRKFTDRDGLEWEVRAETKREWLLEPVGENPERPRSIAAPGYEKDPFELSQEELQRLLDGSDPGHRRSVKSPFAD